MKYMVQADDRFFWNKYAGCATCFPLSVLNGLPFP